MEGAAWQATQKVTDARKKKKAKEAWWKHENKKEVARCVKVKGRDGRLEGG